MSASSLNPVKNSHPHIALIKASLETAQRPVTTTKFGPESAVLLHTLTQIMPDIPVIWVDTGYNTRATLQFAELLTNRLNLNLHTFRPLEEVLEIPPALDDPRHADFTQRVKLKPFQRAVSDLNPDVWFSSIRREQTPFRARQEFISKHAIGYLKVSPLLDWTETDMHQYIADYQLPSESNYYDPTKGEAQRECGLHLNF